MIFHLVSIGGVITDSATYKAFGEQSATSGSTFYVHKYDGLFGYYAHANARYYVGARHLDGNTERWISRDPIGFAGGDLNLYRYVGNGPIVGVDPSGLARWMTVGRWGPYYDHAYIQFIKIKCDGFESFGFWPGGDRNVALGGAGSGSGSGRAGSSSNSSTGSSCKLIGKRAFGPGHLQYPDLHAGEGKPEEIDNTLAFEQALCDCIQQSIKHPPNYCFGRYVCGSWVDEMWECAKNKTKKKKPR